MVNSISSGSLYGYRRTNTSFKSSNVSAPQIKSSDVTKLLKYVNGDTLSKSTETLQSTTTGAMKSAVLWEAIPYVNLLRNSKKLGKSKEVIAKLTELGNSNKDALKAIFNKENGSLVKRIGSYVKTVSTNQKAYGGIKEAIKTEAKLAKQAAKAAGEAGKIGSKLKGLFGIGKGAAAQAAGKETAKAVGKEAAKAGAKSGILGKVLGGNAFIAVINGVIELGTEVIPTFKELGKEKGMKQLGKSAIKVAANTAGYIVGGKAGAALGAAIGSVVPGIGTAIGAALGFVGGLAGSFIAGKLANKVTGKSEREIAKEQQEKVAAKQIISQQDSLKALQQAAANQLMAEAQANGGQLSKDSAEIYNILNKMSTATTATTAATPTTSNKSRYIPSYRMPNRSSLYNSRKSNIYMQPSRKFYA